MFFKQWRRRSLMDYPGDYFASKEWRWRMWVIENGRLFRDVHTKWKVVSKPCLTLDCLKKAPKMVSLISLIIQMKVINPNRISIRKFEKTILNTERALTDFETTPSDESNAHANAYVSFNFVRIISLINRRNPNHFMEPNFLIAITL